MLMQPTVDNLQTYIFLPFILSSYILILERGVKEINSSSTKPRKVFFHYYKVATKLKVVTKKKVAAKKKVATE